MTRLNNITIYNEIQKGLLYNNILEIMQHFNFLDDCIGIVIKIACILLSILQSINISIYFHRNTGGQSKDRYKIIYAWGLTVV